MNLLPLSLLVVHISQRAVSKHFRPLKYIYMERDTERVIFIHIERHKYVHVRMPLRKSVSELLGSQKMKERA